MAVTKHMMLRSWPGAARGRGDRQALCQRSAGLTPPGDVHRHCPDASPGGGRSQAVWPVLGNARPEPRFRCTRPTRDPRPPAERRRASLGGRAFLGLLPVGPGLSASDPFPAPCHRPRSQPALDRKRCTGPTRQRRHQPEALARPFGTSVPTALAAPTSTRTASTPKAAR
jgi:hypothetical protein